jgi:hypothetical protein
MVLKTCGCCGKTLDDTVVRFEDCPNGNDVCDSCVRLHDFYRSYPCMKGRLCEADVMGVNRGNSCPNC